MGNKQPIGVCDSGIGGLTVVKELTELLPNENFIYFGDTARTPYGSRTPAEIVDFMQQILHFFASQQVKLVVIACNTMTATGLDISRKQFSFPLVGVNTGVQRALKVSKSKKIGVIATAATVASGFHGRSAKTIDCAASVVPQACPKLVPLIEGERFNDPEMEFAAQEYLQPLKETGVDALILGCTHYPFIGNLIGKIMGPAVTLVNPAYETSIDTRNMLVERGDLAATEPGSVRFCFSADLDRAKRLTSRIIDGQLPEFELIRLQDFS